MGRRAGRAMPGRPARKAWRPHGSVPGARGQDVRAAAPSPPRPLAAPQGRAAPRSCSESLGTASRALRGAERILCGAKGHGAHGAGGGAPPAARVPRIAAGLFRGPQSGCAAMGATPAA